MQLYWAPQSRALRALWMLEEIGQPYERVLIDIRQGAQETAAYRRINPMGKVPALRDGDALVAESGAVLAYLADRFPAARLAPPIGDPRRGRYLQWLFFVSGSLEGALGEKLAKVPANKFQNGWGSYERVMETIEAALAPGTWLLGADFSAADVLLGIDLNFLCRIVKLIPETPAIAAYLDRCAARPAFQRTMAIDRAAVEGERDMSRTLYSAPLSLFARKVEIALAEKGLAFDRVPVPFTQTRGYSPKHPAVLTANPKGQVPVLVDGDLTLFDSTVICEYLEDAYPTPPLYPETAAARARCRLLELEGDEILLPPLRTLMHRSEPLTDAGKRAQQEFEASKGEAALAGHFESLERRLAGEPFFCGARFTVADIALFMSLLWAQRLKGPGLARHPALAAWYARVLARPAVAKVAQEITAADRELSPDLFR